MSGEITLSCKYGGLVDSRRTHAATLSRVAAVMAAPELDDVNDFEEPHPRRLLSRPTGKRPVPSKHRRDPAGPLRGRLIVTAVAGGAVAAGATAMANPGQIHTSPTTLAIANPSSATQKDARSGIQIVTVATTVASAVHIEEALRGTAFAEERAQREALLRRPLFALPTRGILTSSFGARWGTLHGGLDIANAIGTPVYAATDGVVIASGPTPGYGLWVKIRDANGYVTLYGRVDSTLVRIGQQVIAGDQIARMGNRGNSTGPHLHFEVHADGTDKIDPATWLRERGVAVP